MVLTVSYGYDIHRIELDEKTYAAVKSGTKVQVDGQGFPDEEDGPTQDHWIFNRAPGEIYFWLDNGAEFYGEEVGTHLSEKGGGRLPMRVVSKTRATVTTPRDTIQETE